jgi:CrcB protein
MLNAILVFVGGGLGALGRWGLSGLFARIGGAAWPWGTFGVNILGSLLMGLLAGWLMQGGGLGGESARVRLFLATGVLGGFTTFSAFSLETAHMLEAGHWAQGLLYAGLSVVLCVLAVLLGMALTRLSV